jgi:hypothetical protein
MIGPIDIAGTLKTLMSTVNSGQTLILSASSEHLELWTAGVSRQLKKHVAYRMVHVLDMF